MTYSRAYGYGNFDVVFNDVTLIKTYVSNKGWIRITPTTGEVINRLLKTEEITRDNATKWEFPTKTGYYKLQGGSYIPIREECIDEDGFLVGS